MKTNKLFLMLLTCLFASSVSATIYTVNAGLPYYSPSNLSINVGDTVEWINDGGTHDVNADVNSQTGLSFNNPVSFQSNTTNVVGAIIHTQVFNVLGNYSYDCSVGSHAANGMVGTISVNVPPNSIYDIVSNSPVHTTLKVAIDACALDGTLSGAGPLTLFAPTDAAFNLLPAGTVAALLADIPQLTDILLHHVVGDSVLSTMLSNNLVVPTLNGNVIVTISGAGVFIESGNGTIAQVTGADITADNGVVHVIDAVLLPAPPNSIYDIVSNSSDHTTLKAAIDACSLDGTLSGAGPLTLFAPTDAAFNLLPAGTVSALLADIPALTDILKHHVVGASVMSGMLSNNQIVTTLLGTDVTVTITGGNVYIDNAMVTVADIVADNGVVHVIDAVLIPTSSIYDIVSNSANHTTLKVAIDACALNGVLSDPGSLTLFAPTDAAFNLLPAGTVTALLADIPQLTDILKHHVVGSSVMSGMLSNNQVVTTLLGTDVTVTINSMGVFIDNAMVTVADIVADNGVVHVIDAVLLPTTTSVSELNHLDKEYLYSVNILGEKVNYNLKNQIIFNIFKDGSVEKVFNK
jgi:uncharacterized surface protein with fasciclin (FAS1) repeats